MMQLIFLSILSFPLETTQDLRKTFDLRDKAAEKIQAENKVEKICYNLLTFLLEKPVCAIFDDDVISQRVKGLEAA